MASNTGTVSSNKPHAPELVEKPLGASAKAALIAAGSGAILACYLYALTGVVLLLALVAVEFALLLVALRFGMAGFMARIMGRHMGLTSIFLRSFWLGKDTQMAVPLAAADAPRLFEMLERLSQRLGISAPRTVSLEMSTNAWVRLKGYRAGVGTTILGIGYDLLAGLSDAEVEGVLAHEMAHAKRVQRGVKHLLSGGLRRASLLADGLRYSVESDRQARQSGHLAKALFFVADRLGRLAARLMAAYSRQDEFDADRGAAELCGAATIRSALLKIESFGPLAARLGWRERVARLESGESFSRWLTSELNAEERRSATACAETSVDRYSTHPSLSDRLAALPHDGSNLSAPGNSAIALLAEPDATAEKLIAEIERTVAQREQEDSKRLQKWNRKARGSTHLRPLQTLAFAIFVVGAIGLLCLIFGGEMTFVSMAVVLGIFALAIGLFRWGRYKDRVALPIPDYADLLAAAEHPATANEKNQKELETELLSRVEAEPGKRKKAALLAAEAYVALGRCDFLRAHVASRLCLRFHAKSIEGILSHAIASAIFRQEPQAVANLKALNQLTNLASASTTWGAAWTLIALGEWAHAEAFLDQTLKFRCAPTLLALKATCQARRGKSRSAILAARQACMPVPPNKEYSKLLISLLLENGLVREARARLAALEPEVGNDTDLLFSMVRLHLLRGDFDLAGQWTERLTHPVPNPQTLVGLGKAYETARQREKADGFYRQALGAGHYPEALLGLGRLEAAAGNKSQARCHFLSALDATRTLGREAVGSLRIFQLVIEQIVALNESAIQCRAWLAKLGANAPILPNRALIIYAPDRSRAEASFQEIWNALQPGLPPLMPGTVSWSEAPDHHQPDRPVNPGVQAILS